ncbi:hypothetical protein A3Q56_00217 [Intoshia linei]|uniref:Uncharacterized protein n=1 Tax=Intoshia linei TaxID=1819745 RepID=A0A177BE63_9BILA|nr:hypothetical protein A3Q56_00217 [Intoshia linei]
MSTYIRGLQRDFGVNESLTSPQLVQRDNYLHKTKSDESQAHNASKKEE